jgi:nucleoside phosphorylase
MDRSHDDYTVGWICALPLEMAAAKAMLDEVHDSLPVHQPTDHNTYILGNIKEHNIVIACLPSGDYGLVSANTVAMQLLSSFHSIRFGLMVGIGGGVPNSSADIRLGDVVISKPTDTYGGVVQYDYGKALSGGGFQRTGMLNRPPQILLTALSKLQANHLTGESKMGDFIAGVKEKFPLFARPTQEDHLYLSDYDHIDTNSTNCTACDPIKLVSRPSRGHNEPLVHYGLIASANKLIRDSKLRDNLSRDLGAYCVEMEAAGLMNKYPCLVARGICDYADSHKNKKWQGYASAVAAAYAKELILCTPASDINHTRSAEETISGMFIDNWNDFLQSSRVLTMF